jgi:cytochrome c peroxidase
MKKRFLLKSKAVTRLLAIITIVCTVMQGGMAWAAPATLQLSAVTNPVLGIPGNQLVPVNVRVFVPPGFVIPANLAPYIKDMNAAITLGKALFWDMQTGSDGIQACASCHYRAGADPLSVRSKNQVNPGPNNAFDVKDVAGASGANLTLTAAAFPFFQKNPVTAQAGAGAITNNLDDIFGSQGVTKNQFVAILLGSRTDNGTSIIDAVFQAGGTNVRQVTGRNTPSAVNAVFNFQNFWDGRAHNTFNGNNPLGPLDPAQNAALPVPGNSQTGVWVNNGTAVDPILVNQKVVGLTNSSLASQAVGPPLSPVEMSFGGRTFPQLGRKMLSAGIVPLGIQLVSPTDSVLGPLSNAPAGKKGLKTTYTAMIQNAFQDIWWNAATPTPDGFTQMEANFSLFWGLAVQAYEATQVSDLTPLDTGLTNNPANPFAPNTPEARGFALFNGKCASCHSGNEMTEASVSNMTGLANKIDATNPTATPGLTDIGFINIGVRPTADDLGRGATINFPLSFAAQAEIAAGNAALLPAGLTNPFTPVNSPLPVANNATPLQVNGSFKTPALRNVELTAPYMHNGSIATLDDVIDFYNRGGNIANAERDTGMNGTVGVAAPGSQNHNDLVAFLKALTDPRVKNESAPFDHPELLIPNGDASGPTMTRLPAKGADGAAETPLPTVALDPATPTTTTKASLTIGGTKEAGAAVKIAVNTAAALPADTTTDTTWSTTLTGLAVGANTVTVTTTALDGVVTTKTASLTLAFPSGILTSGATAISVADALRALRIAIGLIPQTPADLANGDVAPLVGGLPAPDGQIDVADAMVILRKVIGLEHF